MVSLDKNMKTKMNEVCAVRREARLCPFNPYAEAQMVSVEKEMKAKINAVSAVRREVDQARGKYRTKKMKRDKLLDRIRKLKQMKRQLAWEKRMHDVWTKTYMKEREEHKTVVSEKDANEKKATNEQKDVKETDGNTKDDKKRRRMTTKTKYYVVGRRWPKDAEGCQKMPKDDIRCHKTKVEKP